MHQVEVYTTVDGKRVTLVYRPDDPEEQAPKVLRLVAIKREVTEKVE